MKVIEVCANPYIALDKDGVPQGAVQTPGALGTFIGAHIDPILSLKTGKTRFYFPKPYVEKGERGVGGLRVVRVALNPSIANAVRAGELIAANEESAYVCGIRGEEYLEPAKALAVEREKAAEYLAASQGDAQLQAIPQERTEEELPEGFNTSVVRLSPTLAMTKAEA